MKSTAAEKKVGGKFVGGDPVMRPLADYKACDWNPNRFTPAERKAFREVLATIGWVKSQAMLVWASDEKKRKRNIIIDGQHRWEEASRLGFTQGPVVELHGITRKEAIAWTIRIDKVRGTFDEPELAKLLDVEFGLFTSDVAPDVGLRLGFTTDDLEELRPKLPPRELDISGGEGEAQDDDAFNEPPTTAPITKLGDVWELGAHRVICGDTFDEETRKKAFRGEVVDMVLTDPPFAIYGSSTGLGADMTDDQMVRPFYATLFRTIRNEIKEFGHAYVCCDWRSWASVWDGAARGKMSTKNLIVWDKGGGGLGASYANTYELIGFFARLPPPTAMKSTTKRTGQRTVNAPNLLRFNRAAGAERLHNAAKPVDLMRKLIHNSSDAGELVVDFFGGSGTVLIAAEREERRSVTFEIDPRWIDVIVQRWESATGGKGKRIKA